MTLEKKIQFLLDAINAIEDIDKARVVFHCDWAFNYDGERYHGNTQVSPELLRHENKDMIQDMITSIVQATIENAKEHAQ